METKIFTPLESREPISKIVSAKIEDAILKKIYPAGSKLPSEYELCEQFGVSRTSVREALQTLAAQGLVNVIKGKGMYVNEVSSDSVSAPLHKYLKLKLSRNYVLDLVHARQMIEPEIAYHAALKHKKSDIDKLHADIEDLRNCTDSYQQLGELDMKFHIDLAIATQNSIMPLLLDPIHKLVPELKSVVYAAVSDAKEAALIWHTKILNEVISGDADKARQAMVEHLKIAENHALKMLKYSASKK